jgi:hypothetical protein
MVAISSVSSILRGPSSVLLPLFLLVAAPATARQAVPAPLPGSVYLPADSLEGNFLSAYIAGVSRDTEAAALFYRWSELSWRCSPTAISTPPPAQPRRWRPACPGTAWRS